MDGDLGKDLGRKRSWPVRGTTYVEGLRNTMKHSIEIAGVPAEVRTERLPNIGCCHYISPLHIITRTETNPDDGWQITKCVRAVQTYKQTYPRNWNDERRMTP
jgi:hypothetical protein